MRIALLDTGLDDVNQKLRLALVLFGDNADSVGELPAQGLLGNPGKTSPFTEDANPERVASR